MRSLEINEDLYRNTSDEEVEEDDLYDPSSEVDPYQSNNSEDLYTHTSLNKQCSIESLNQVKFILIRFSITIKVGGDWMD